MRYVNPTTGKVFMSIQEAKKAFCAGPETDACFSCPISSRRNGTGKNCSLYCHYHSIDAAFLMGYTITGDKPTDTALKMEEDMENKDKPRLAKVLGVEEDEEWTFPEMPGVFRVHDGVRQFRKDNSNVRWWNCGREDDLSKIINHPELIVHFPRLTEPELAICKAIGAIYLSLESNDNFVKAWMDNPGIEGAGDGSWIRFNNGGNLYSFIAKIRKDLFPSVHPGDLIEVPERGITNAG